MKTNLLSITRGMWAILPEWVQGNSQLINDMMKGEGFNAEAFKRDETTASRLMYSPMYNVGLYSKIDELPQNSIAFVDVIGAITKYGSWCAYGAMELAELVEKLDAAENISAIIFNIDSPGGQVNGTAHLAGVIADCSKRTIAFINDGYAASAAYWIASACNEIYCSHNTDQVGSIGVYCTLRDYNEYLRSQGMPVFEIYAPSSKDKNADAKEALKGNTKLIEGELEVLAQAFITGVKEGRGSKLKGTGWDSGKMFFAPDALKMGLIDGIKNLAEITEMLDAELSGEAPIDQEEKEADQEEQAPADSGEEETASTDTPDTNDSTTNTETTMFGKNKFKALSALSGKKAEDLTEDEITAANTELHAEGIDEDVVLASASDIKASADRIAELEAEVKTLGKKPGGFFRSATTTTGKAAEGDKQEEAEDDTEALLAGLDHNRKADALYR